MPLQEPRLRQKGGHGRRDARPRCGKQLPANPDGRSNADVLKPWFNGMDLTRRSAGKWIIAFGTTISPQESALLRDAVRPRPRTRLADA